MRPMQWTQEHGYLTEVKTDGRKVVLSFGEARANGLAFSEEAYSVLSLIEARELVRRLQAAINHAERTAVSAPQQAL